MPGTSELFAENNIRCTTQRRALYEALVATDSHPTAEELYRMVKPTTSRLSRATVYNTLETLCGVGPGPENTFRPVLPLRRRRQRAPAPVAPRGRDDPRCPTGTRR